jgi:uncharacterized protein (DUF2147 family)
MKSSMIAAALLLSAASVPVLAQDAKGTWLHETGNAHVRIADCGSALCGVISWTKDNSTPARVGQRVFYDMKPSKPNAWAGNAFNPEDGKTYSGTMTLSGNSLTTAGCVFGGLICKSVHWTRVN